MVTLSRPQAGVLSTTQLLAVAGARASVRSLIALGALRRAGRGVYVVSGGAAGDSDWEQSVWISVLSAGPGAFAFRRTAARWWDLDGASATPAGVAVDVAVGAGHQSRRPGVARLDPLLPGDVVEERCLRVTSVERTLLDMGAVVDDPILERSLECALRRHDADLGRLQDRARHGRTPGGRRLDRLLAARGDVPPTESDAETLFLQVARRAGLPDPHRQYGVLLGGRRCRLDFAWPAVRLAVEVDGFEAHGSPSALHADLQRQNRLILDGWFLLRFTWRAVTSSPRAVEAELARAWRLAAGSQLAR